MGVFRDRTSDSSVDQILSSYERVGAVPDELVGEDGNIRPVWQDLVRTIAEMPSGELTARMTRGDQYLRDAGVYYRQYGSRDSSERDWPLSHMPVLIDGDEWEAIANGLRQRANLLETILADVYGPNNLVRQGLIPPPLLAENPEWLRPLVGITPRSGNFLHFIAFDIGRGPDGNWWVLGDRTQAPSGAGFALENRMATARVFSDVFGRSTVERLAGFFRDFRDAINDLRGDPYSQAAILTPGPMNDTYFEHAFIARYLGFNLLEGEDLTVRNGNLMVRTVSGLEPVSVIWRRLDAQWADPLELNEASRLGTPGLLGAVRKNSVTMINALGSGVLETRSFLAFIPRIAEALLGEPLIMPNIATWWCGQKNEREYVKANASIMMVGDAFSTRLPFDRDEVYASNETLNSNHYSSLEAFIDAKGSELVGQEAVTLSTAPAFSEGILTARPMSLRVFLARTVNGWHVMPGGFARIGRSGNSPELAMQEGGSVADVWIARQHHVDKTSIIDLAHKQSVKIIPGLLPSRAADNLFWLGRYVERTETIARLTRAYNLRLAETDFAETPILSDLSDYMATLGIDTCEALPSVLRDTLASAGDAGGHVRDRFSMDGWHALSDLQRTVDTMASRLTKGYDATDAMGVILRKLSGFSGLVHENMYRFTGWRFLSIGRSLERAIAMLHLLQRFADPDAEDGGLDLALEIGDSTMSYRRRFSVTSNRRNVLELLALDPLNPRSVVHQFEKMSEHLSFLPGAEQYLPYTPPQRALLRTNAAIAGQSSETLDSMTLGHVEESLNAVYHELVRLYFR